MTRSSGRGEADDPSAQPYCLVLLGGAAGWAGRPFGDRLGGPGIAGVVEVG